MVTELTFIAVALFILAVVLMALSKTKMSDEDAGAVGSDYGCDGDEKASTVNVVDPTAEILMDSKRISSLRYVNRRYPLSDATDIVLYAKCASKAEFDHFRPEQFVLEKMVEDSGRFQVFVARAANGQKLAKDYYEALRAIPQTQYDNLTYIEIESQLFDSMIQHPRNQPRIFVSWSYTSPGGANVYNDSSVFTYSEATDLLLRSFDLEQRRQARQEFIKRERSKMSSSMRYDVLRRDGFKCVLCGASADDGAKLEVDHIIPVSKGGKTEMSNLRTLCDRCNRGKSDKVE